MAMAFSPCRRLAVEKELAAAETAPHPNAVFDQSGNFLL
jgi:hypothetical protein